MRRVIIGHKCILFNTKFLVPWQGHYQNNVAVVVGGPKSVYKNAQSLLYLSYLRVDRSEERRGEADHTILFALYFFFAGQCCTLQICSSSHGAVFDLTQFRDHNWVCGRVWFFSLHLQGFDFLAHKWQTSIYLKIYMCNDELLLLLLTVEMEYIN